jgi:hypothetical protein
MDLEFLQYPIGRASIEKNPGEERVESSIAVIGRLPQQLMEFAKGLTAEQWDMPYREGGWSPRQVVHHLADSHMNGFNRQRLAVVSPEVPSVTRHILKASGLQYGSFSQYYPVSESSRKMGEFLKWHHRCRLGKSVLPS